MRLIDADALIEKLCGDCFGKKGGCQLPCYLKTLVLTMPTIEAESVNHAYVITDEDGNIECSNCGSSNCFDNYCGNCGAKMDGRESDNGKRT